MFLTPTGERKRAADFLDFLDITYLLTYLLTYLMIAFALWQIMVSVN